MSEKTRIKRPTYATPRKPPAGRMIHQSTNIQSVMVPSPDGLGMVAKTTKGKGNTFTRK